MRAFTGIIALVILLISNVNAQYLKKAISEGIQNPQSNTRALSDTLGFDYYIASTTTCYKASGSGYVYGNNLLKDKAKAIQYDVNYPVQLHSIIFKLSKKIYTSGNIASSISLNIHSLDAKGQGITETKDAPGGIIHTSYVNLGSIDTGVFINVPITGYLHNPGSFAISVSFEKLTEGDTIGLQSTLDGVYLAIEHSWEQEENGSWSTTKKTWNIDAMPALFAYTSDVTGIQGINNSKPRIYPNPSSDFIYLNDELLKSEISISDVSGKIIYQSNKTNLIDVRNWKPGVYFLNSGKNTSVLLIE